MNSKPLRLTSMIALATVTFITACGGGDQRGRNSSGPRTAFEGTWMSQSVFQDFNTAGRNFCAVVAQNPERHGLSRSRFGIPDVRILIIAPEGNIFRWHPKLRVGDPGAQASRLYVGRINADGTPSAGAFNAGRSANGGYWKTMYGGQIEQVYGRDAFAVGNDDLARRDVSASSNDARYVRINEDQLTQYVFSLRSCAPSRFDDLNPRPREPRPAMPVDPRANDAAVLPRPARPSIPAPAAGPAARPEEPTTPDADDADASAQTPAPTVAPAPAAPTRRGQGMRQDKVRPRAGYLPGPKDQ